MWLIVFAGLFLSWSKPSLAKDYSIDRVNIKNVVSVDGSINVEEERIYNFEGSYSFAYQYINKKGERDEPYGLENFEVCDENKCFEQKNEDINIPETFLVRDERERYYLKWFYKARDEKKTFKIRYKIKNAVDLGEDFGQIYWKAIGDEWEVSQRNIKIDFELPAGIEGDEIRAWGHGPSGGMVSIVTNQLVNFEVDKLNIGKGVETRILLPKNIFSQGVEINKKSGEVVREENEFIAETERKREQNVRVLRWGLIGGLGLILVQIWELIKRIKLFWNFGKDGKLPKINLSGRIWEPPSEIDPAQVEQLINGTKTISPNSSTATILSLVGGGYYRIERSQKKEGFIFKKYHYFLIKTEKEVKLSSIQEAVVRLLDNVFGKENKIDLKDIGKWTKKHTEKTRKFLTETWPEVVKRENIKEGFFDRMADKKLKDYISPLHVGVAVIMVIVIILASTIGQILLIPILIFPLVVAIISIIIMAGLKSYGLKRT